MDDTRERLIRLETRHEILERRQVKFEADVMAKLDSLATTLTTEMGELKTILAMGKGGYRALAVAGSLIVAVVTAFFWVKEHMIGVIK